MQEAAKPPNEDARIRKLDSYRILDTPSEAAFDRITRIVADTIGVPMSLMSLVDRDRQWFKSHHGIDVDQTDRSIAFCSHAILGNDVFEIPDAKQDPRFADNPLVVGAPNIRFYAGAPLKTPDGLNMGTLCVVDSEPRTLTETERHLLSDLAILAVDQMELRVALRQAVGDLDESERMQRQKDDFIASVTHELRTPLTAIRGSLGLLQGGAAGELQSRAADLVTIANRNVDNLLDLINDLLDSQQLAAGRMDFEFNAFEPAHLLRDTCEELEGVATLKNVILEQLTESVPTVFGDADRLRQVLANLIANAIKFSPPGAIVTAKMGHNETLLRYSVTDRGQGIPEEFRPRIFGKFNQAAGPGKTKGTGLGLAISKAIVEAHQGRISYESTVGQGTTFHVELPLRPSVVARVD